VSSRLRTGLLVAALLAVGTATGCGSSDSEGPARQVLVDEVLRPAVARAPADARTGVRYVASRSVLERPIDRDSTALLVLSSPIFPVWDPQEDGVTASRIVSEDRAVLVAPERGPQAVDDLPARAVVLRPRAPDTARRAASLVVQRLPKPLGGSRDTAARIRETASDAASLQALRSGDAAAAVVLRSSLRRDGAAGLRTLPLDDAVAPRLRLQVGTVDATPTAGRLRSWLVGPAGRRALIAAGFDGPGPAATSEPCVAGSDGCR
jgi:hypothetical protein